MYHRYPVKVFYSIKGALLLCLVLYNISSFAQSISCPPNIDFEMGNYSNWRYYKGTSFSGYIDAPDGGGCCPISTPTYCGYGTPCISPTVRHQIVTGTGTDPYGGFPIVAPGGAYSFKLGNNSVGGQAEKIRYFINVPAGTTNFLLIYRYAIVFQNPGHLAPDQPRFEVKLYDSATNAPLPCGQLSYISSTGLPGFMTSTFGVSVLYRPWDSGTVNLTPYAGSTVALDFATGDCAQGGHFGYAYVDMRCGTFTNIIKPCDTTSALTLTAPPGYASYTWYDSATMATVYGTGASIVVPNPVGPMTYAVVMTPYSGVGCPVTSYVRVLPSALAFHPTPDTAICFGSTVSLAANATDVVSPLTYSWSPGTGLSCSTCPAPVSTPTVGTTYSLSVTNQYGCHKDTTITINVGPPPGPTTGPSSVCVGSTITLFNAVPGGTWISTSSNATVSSTGVVTGVAVGTAVISYATSAVGCGTSYATKTITVVGPPVNIISGPTAVCVAGTITLTSGAPGGAWSSSGTATVSPAGVVTGLTSGTAIITYTASNACGASTDTAVVAVDVPAVAGTITGPSMVCVGNSITMTASVPGGVWSYSPLGLVTMTGGMVTALVSGVVTISYTVTNACGSVSATKVVTINPLAPAVVISGASVVCAGASITMTASSSGGTWSASGTATVSATGVVTGTSGGTATISYTLNNGCGTTVATKVVTVDPAPPAGVISGPSSVCVGSTITMTTSLPGGVWGITPITVATITPAGVVTGIAAGTAVVMCTYTSATSCITIVYDTIIVNPAPNAGAIVGPGTVCVGSSITLTNSVSGGTWSSSGSATVSATGVVTGTAGGTATISYSVTNVCGTAVATTVITVNPLPTAGTISGPPMVCVGSTITMTSSVPGGTWSISGGGAATISGGMVSGITAGSATVTYVVTTVCGNDTATAAVTVNPLPDPGTITGPVSLCIGTTYSALVPSVPGGTWSSSPTGIVAISPGGTVTGMGGGTATVSYSVTNICGVASATTTATVVLPPPPATIIGPSIVCPGSTITLMASAAGGTWSITGGSASISPSGVVTGLSVGTALVTYTLNDSCGDVPSTKLLSVNLLPDAGAISGATSLCTTQSITMSATVAGGSWSCSPGGTISSTGVLSGVAPGTVTVSYSVTNVCGTATATFVVTVNPTPPAGVVSSLLSLCEGGTATLTSTVTGGVWTTSSGIISVTPAGVVSGLSAGTANVTYAVSSAYCTGTATATVTVDPLAAPPVIAGGPKVCVGGTITLSGTPSGGYWSSTGTTGSISTTGVVSGVSAGTLTITYTTIHTCGNVNVTYVVSVDPLPTPAVTGPHDVCVGSTVTLSAGTSGGSWSSSSPTVAYVSAGGLVSGLSAGTALVSFTITVSGCTGTTVYSVTVSPPPPVGTVSGPPVACLGSDIRLTSTNPGGTWTSGNPAVAVVNSATGEIHGVAEGTVMITYTSAAGATGCVSTATYLVAILSAATFTMQESITNVSCNGRSDGSIGIFPAGGAGPWTFLWAHGSTAHLVEGLGAGNYNVEVTDSATGCRASKDFQITQPQALEVKPTVTKELCDQKNGAITLTVTGGTTPYKYQWSDNSTADHLSDKAAGMYTVLVTDEHRCGKELAAEITTGDCDDLVIHDGVSPNGDGVNDFWVIDGIELYRNNLVQLYDKWGDKIFEQRGYNNKWDGRGLNGSEIPDGTYFYIVKLNADSKPGDKNIWTGTLLIKR